jgi:hypothetical protein
MLNSNLNIHRYKNNFRCWNRLHYCEELIEIIKMNILFVQFKAPMKKLLIFGIKRKRWRQLQRHQSPVRMQAMSNILNLHSNRESPGGSGDSS